MGINLVIKMGINLGINLGIILVINLVSNLGFCGNLWEFSYELFLFIILSPQG